MDTAPQVLNRSTPLRSPWVRAADATVAALHWGQEREVAAVLTRAFADDPLVNAICDTSASQRPGQMLWSFRMAVRTHCLSPQPAWTIADARAGLVGVVMISRPGMTLNATPDTLFVLRGLLHVGPRAALRGMRAGQTIAAHAPPGPFTYLRTLGIDPSFHGRGFGSRLIKQALSAAPTAWPVYLETAKEKNLSFYARHGLRCIGEFECLGVRVWRLLRPPLPHPLAVDGHAASVRHSEY